MTTEKATDTLHAEIAHLREQLRLAIQRGDTIKDAWEQTGKERDEALRRLKVEVTGVSAYADYAVERAVKAEQQVAAVKQLADSMRDSMTGKFIAAQLDVCLGEGK